MSELNNRQWALYRFLIEQGDKWTYQEDIAKALPDWYAPIEETKDYHNTKERHLMTKDIRAINDSAVIQKIVLSNPSKGVKIANEKEWQECIKRDYISVFKRLQRIRNKERKGRMDGQTRLVFNSERDRIEAFLHEA